MNDMQKIHLTQSDVNDIIKLTDEGKCPEEIAEWIGCSVATVRRHKSRLGLARVYGKRKAWTRDEELKLIDLYDEDIDLYDIAYRLGRSKRAVMIHAARMRGRGIEVHRQKNGRKKK